jgi:uncharacterized protein YggE
MPNVIPRVCTPCLPYSGSEHLYKKRENYIMEVQGDGRVKVEPDKAYVYISIITENKDVKISQKENAVRTNSVIEAVKTLGVAQEDIETISYTINKTYDYVEGRKVFRTYEVKNDLKITVRDLEKVGQVYDTAVENGANVSQKITFAVSNPQKYYRKALKLSIQNAKLKAVDIANTMEISVNKVPVKIIEETYIDMLKAEYSQNVSLKAAANGTPVQPKELEVKARVKVIFGYF